MSMMIRRGVARVAKATPVVSYEKPVPEPVKEEVKEEPVKEEPKVNLDALSWGDLKNLAQQNGISVYGKKAADIKEELVKMGL